MEIGPAHGVVNIPLLRVYLLQCHQTFVVDSACPQTAGTDFLDIGWQGGVTVLRHEVIVSLLCCLEHFFLGMSHTDSQACQTKGD